MALRRKCWLALQWIIIIGLVVGVLKLVYIDVIPSSRFVPIRQTESIHSIKTNVKPSVFSKGMANGKRTYRPSNPNIKNIRRHLANKGGTVSDSEFKYESIMEMKPIRYLPNFRNPCWNGTIDNGPIHDNRIHCLPYFYILEYKFSDPRLLEYYIYMFEAARKSIQKIRNANVSDNITNIRITGEGTPANLHIQGLWDHLPGNKGLSEPRYTNLHYIKHLIPDVKIIIIFRNPVDRLYSDFLHSSRSRSAETFHVKVSSTVSLYKECFDQFSFRHCMYNYTLMEKTKKTFAFTAGFYAFHMKEILHVFAPDQVLPIILDSYISDMKNTLKRVYSFLGLRIPNPAYMERLMQLSARNRSTKKKKKAGPMLNKTKELLERFYRPYNEEMAKLMHDDRYLFGNV